MIALNVIISQLGKREERSAPTWDLRARSKLVFKSPATAQWVMNTNFSPLPIFAGLDEKSCFALWPCHLDQCQPMFRKITKPVWMNRLGQSGHIILGLSRSTGPADFHYNLTEQAGKQRERKERTRRLRKGFLSSPICILPRFPTAFSSLLSPIFGNRQCWTSFRSQQGDKYYLPTMVSLRVAGIYHWAYLSLKTSLGRPTERQSCSNRVFSLFWLLYEPRFVLLPFLESARLIPCFVASSSGSFVCKWSW